MAGKKVTKKLNQGKKLSARKTLNKPGNAIELDSFSFGCSNG